MTLLVCERGLVCVCLREKKREFMCVCMCVCGKRGRNGIGLLANMILNILFSYYYGLVIEGNIYIYELVMVILVLVYYYSDWRY